MKRKRGGFTLIELLIVIAIIAVLVAVAIPMVSSELNKAKTVTCAANRRSLKAVVANAFMTGEYDSFQKAFDALYDKSVYTCPDGGTFSWKDDNDSGTVICSIHGDGSGSGQSSGGTTPAADGSVTLKDSTGGTHTLSPNAKWTEVQQTVTAGGMNISAGTVVSDSSGTYLLDAWNGWIPKQDVSGMTAAQFAAAYPGKFIRLTNGGSVLTEADQTTKYGQKVWKNEIPSGTICYSGGRYYVVPVGSAVNVNTLPPGGWILIPQ